MLALAALQVFLTAFAEAAPAQKAPDAATQPAQAYECDVDGVIRCSYDQVETVTGSRSLEDMRIIGKFIQLVSERNRRYYLAWHTKQPSASYELVKRVKPFPYLPYGDTYSVLEVEIILNQPKDRLTVRYPKKPKLNSTAPIPESGFATYETKLSDFIKNLQKDIEKFKKYEK
jgi:hypothetical protein